MRGRGRGGDGGGREHVEGYRRNKGKGDEGRGG